MQFEVLTLFPELFPGALAHGVTGRALSAGLVGLTLHNLRDYTHDRHRQVDDVPYGGGAGMVLKPEPIFEAVRARQGSGPVILLSPQGELFNQRIARELAQQPDLYLICGPAVAQAPDRKSTRLNSSHTVISYAVFCLKKKKRHKAQAASATSPTS